MTATVSALSGCDVSQINWGNRTYTVSGDCVHLATVTLHDGQAVTPDGVTVHLQQVHLNGDINGDGVADAVLYFACTKATPGGTQQGSEIQVFSRNAKPLARVLPPYFYLQPLGAFDPANIQVTAGKLLTDPIREWRLRRVPVGLERARLRPGLRQRYAQLTQRADGYSATHVTVRFSVVLRSGSSG